MPQAKTIYPRLTLAGGVRGAKHTLLLLRVLFIRIKYKGELMPSTTALEFFNKRRKTTLYMENAKEENSSTKKKVKREL
ncbi:hypothetical protein OWV82_022799 [Melia azedarach]|uniref:Uncharacterized protein n=1 Tax=Melia azedarach TaxID=155640 RepID=A0ACC1WV83_MELAZ|nr:hypothetical protein OWV82_022799 [Melia azedarach]